MRINKKTTYLRKKLKKIRFLRMIYRLAEKIGVYLSFFINFFIKKTNKSITKFIIFVGSTRSGSRLLRDLLNSHPEIHCDGEILFPKVFFPPLLFIKAKCALSKKNIYGFKAFLDHLRGVHKLYNPRQIMLDLHTKGWKIIYLTRRNILHQAISNLVKEYRKERGKLGHLKITDGPVKLEKIHIDCNELIRVIRQREERLVQGREVLKGLPHLTVVYEDDLLRAEDHQNTLDRIFNYLGVSSMPVKTKYVRTSTDRLSDSIQNYEEIIRVISNTEYARFLVD